MADYAKTLLVPIYSKSSDYSDNMLRQASGEETISGATAHRSFEMSVATSSTTLVAANVFTTITELVVRNKDSTNYVDVVCTTAAGAVNIRLSAGRSCKVPVVTASSAVTATANTAACLCEVQVVGT